MKMIIQLREEAMAEYEKLWDREWDLSRHTFKKILDTYRITRNLHVMLYESISGALEQINAGRVGIATGIIAQDLDVMRSDTEVLQEKFNLNMARWDSGKAAMEAEYHKRMDEMEAELDKAKADAAKFGVVLEDQAEVEKAEVDAREDGVEGEDGVEEENRIEGEDGVEGEHGVEGAAGVEEEHGVEGED